MEVWNPHVISAYSAALYRPLLTNGTMSKADRRVGPLVRKAVGAVAPLAKALLIHPLPNVVNLSPDPRSDSTIPP